MVIASESPGLEIYGDYDIDIMKGFKINEITSGNKNIAIYSGKIV